MCRIRGMPDTSSFSHSLGLKTDLYPSESSDVPHYCYECNDVYEETVSQNSLAIVKSSISQLIFIKEGSL